ncbi:hypothetical protein [Glycomyces xiaoerkulensis]|uniref:hypothetical protein n=1 Tax=Glycomyces xiaoerkulensis TaxID=2038139 RepID=UPI0012FFDB24|nr:hypothetical protein [Glycomyces xiaoerkulensis]
MAQPTEPNEERLRRAPTTIGDEASRSNASPAPSNRTGSGRRLRIGPTLAGAAATLALGLLIFGLIATDLDDNGNDEASDALSTAEVIACSDLIAEGEIVAVEQSDTPDRIVVTFDVQDAIAPAEASGIVELEFLDPVVADEIDPLTPGEHLLLLVYERNDEAPGVVRGDDIEDRRSHFEDSLPDADEATCPAYMQEGSTADPPSVPGDS